MTSYNDIKKGYENLNSGANETESSLTYTFNCGRLDLGHAFHPPSGPSIGAANLWRQIQAESPLDARLSFGHTCPSTSQ